MMPYIENPKLVGSNLVGCFPQGKPCPIGCNQCYANQPGASYAPMDCPNVPSPEEAGSRIVRMNDLGDSNIDKDIVLETAKQYENVFFNTSQPNIDFPGPVVLTINADEDRPSKWILPTWFLSHDLVRLIAIRVRVTPANVYYLQDALAEWRARGVAVLLMHMRYYDRRALVKMAKCAMLGIAPMKALLERYTHKMHIKNESWQPNEELKRELENKLGVGRHPNTYVCEGPLCKDCRQCEALYLLAKRRMRR